MGSVALTCHPSGMRFASALCRMVAQLSGVHCFPSCVVTETFNQLFCGRRLIKNMGLHVSACEPLYVCLPSIKILPVLQEKELQRKLVPLIRSNVFTENMISSSFNGTWIIDSPSGKLIVFLYES